MLPSVSLCNVYDDEMFFLWEILSIVKHLIQVVYYYMCINIAQGSHQKCFKKLRILPTFSLT